ncbi:hypothetical protein [Demequina gelatinilytica]|uniref:hypothetical protein n=1 Tax=Demequina gelatinilytica TaxID=1638980 RepID=UPI000784BE91|nr:hypothetical protein [Demequina gelatinilytica]
MTLPRVILLLGSVLVAAACGTAEPTEVRGPVPIVGWSNAGDVQILHIDTCNGGPVAEVVETETAVTITVTSTSLDPGPACQDVLEVELGSDLGGHQVIDGVTGEEPPGIEG